jgi:DNA polymerase III sliding clamp (beta) subunit (PCNA family)
MIIVNLTDLKNILKNASTLCEKKNIVSVFDVIFIVKDDQMIVITEGVSGASAHLIAIENKTQCFCMIKTGFNILSKIIGNITTESLVLQPQEQGVLLINSHQGVTKEKKSKKNIDMNFSIYSHNLYFNDQEYVNEENFNKYKIYWDFLINHQWQENKDTVIQMESTNKFIQFLKHISYAASTDNDRSFSNIFFQWEANQLTANSSNRIRIAVGKLTTINECPTTLKFSCDKKSINSFIKSVQHYSNEPLTLRITDNHRIYCLMGNNFMLEMGYSVKRSINTNEFFNVLENSQGFLCNTEEFKKAIQCGKSFATKFHYSILLENVMMGPSSSGDFDWDDNNNQDNSSLEQEKTIAESHGGPEESPWKLRFFFQEPNHGNIQTYIDESFQNSNKFSVEVNVLYLWDAITAIETKQCLLMINSQHSYLFLIPWQQDMDLTNLKNTYKSAHLIMCLR